MGRMLCEDMSGQETSSPAADEAVLGGVWISATTEGSLAPYLLIEASVPGQSLRSINAGYAGPRPRSVKCPTELNLLEGATPWRANNGALRALLAPSVNCAQHLEPGQPLSDWSLPVDIQAIVILVDERGTWPRHPALAGRRPRARTLQWAAQTELPLVVAVMQYGRGELPESRFRLVYQIPPRAVVLAGPAPSKQRRPTDQVPGGWYGGILAAVFGAGETRFDRDYAAGIVSAVGSLLGEAEG